MSSFISRPSAVLAAAIGMAIVMGSAAPAAHADPQARSAKREASRSGKETAATEQRYPNAAREVEAGKASSRTMRKINAMMDLYQEGNAAEARVAADEILADGKANDYEKAYSAQIAAQAAYETDDLDAAVAYLQQAIELDALDNNGHYGAMLNLAQMQQMQEKYADSLATFDRFFEETGSAAPEDLMMKGQALYLMERYAEAGEVMESAISASDNPKPEWQALLMQVYTETGNSAEAVRMAESVAAAKPDDKRALLNLAVVYDQADMPEKAVEVLEKLRAGGQLSTANEYNQLYVTYLNMEGRERQAAEVINEGLENGALQPDYGSYVALAQAYYFSDQPAQAIEAYQKAAPLAKDGETYLNLAKVLLQEDRGAEAKAAAQQALAKGISNPKDADAIIAAGD